MKISDLFEADDMPPSDEEIKTKVIQFNHYRQNLERHGRKRGLDVQFTHHSDRKNYLHFTPWMAGTGIEKTTNHHIGLSNRLAGMLEIARYFLSLNVFELGEDAVNELWHWSRTVSTQLLKSAAAMQANFPTNIQMQNLQVTPGGKYDSAAKTYTNAAGVVWDEVGHVLDGTSYVFVRRDNYTENSHPSSQDVEEFKQLIKLYEDVECFHMRLHNLA